MTNLDSLCFEWSDYLRGEAGLSP